MLCWYLKAHRIIPSNYLFYSLDDSHMPGPLWRFEWETSPNGLGAFEHLVSGWWRCLGVVLRSVAQLSEVHHQGGFEMTSLAPFPAGSGCEPSASGSCSHAWGLLLRCPYRQGLNPLGSEAKLFCTLSWPWCFFTARETSGVQTSSLLSSLLRHHIFYGAHPPSNQSEPWCFSFRSPHHTGIGCLYQASVHWYASSLVYQLQPCLVICWLTPLI